jgi:hypothetical protein
MIRTTGIRVAVAGIVLGLIALLTGCKSVPPEAEASSDPVRMESREPTAAPDRPLADEDDDAMGSEPALDLVLRFVPGRSVTYKVTTETEAAVRWEGDESRKPDVFRGGAIGNRVEITFEQRYDRVDDNGNAVVEVRILAVRYLGRSRETVVLDFDSAQDVDREGPLSKLIGRSYQLEMTPTGAVVSVDGLAGIGDSIRGGSPEHQTALRLISEREIRDRHEVPALMALEDKTVHPGDTWSNVRLFSFGRMGARAYERLYTLDRVEVDGKARLAHVVMRGIPSSAAAEQLHQEQPEVVAGGLFDQLDSYEGQLLFDPDVGRIDAYVEQFHTEWVAIDQQAVQDGDANPAAIRMARSHLYRLERVR